MITTDGPPVIAMSPTSLPVVIWKGGKGEGGQRAISSHTGSLAASPTVWEAMVRQAGAISVTGPLIIA